MAAGLATRCPACGTVFRVVPDQLRVSEGWVRCGRCADVFNAAEALVDLDGGAARNAAAPAVADRGPTTTSPGRLADFKLQQSPEQAPAPAAEPAAEPEPVRWHAVPPTVDTTESRFADDAFQADARGDAGAAFERPSPPADGVDASTATAASTLAKTPSFLRRAERAQR